MAAARIYFACQAIAGAVWWTLVFRSESVRTATLGQWAPEALVVPDVALFVGASAIAATGSRHTAAINAAWTVAITIALGGYALIERAAGWGTVAMAAASIGSVAAASTMWFGRLPMHWFFVGPFKFVPAPERTGAGHLRRSLTQLVVFWTAFFVAVPVVVAAIERRLRVDAAWLDQSGFDIVGVVVLVVFSALGLWSCVTMALLGRGTPLPVETARELVVTGPYRFIRNPMAAAGALQTIGVGIWTGSWIVVALAVAGAVAWHVAIRPGEELDLATRFGDSYERYRSAVRCWVPRW